MEEENEFGVEVAWWEHDINSVNHAKSCLERQNFIIHLSEDVDEIESWVCRNGYDVLLTDLHTEGERGGTELIQGVLKSSKRIPIIPVSSYLGNYEAQLRKISPELAEIGFDKTRLKEPSGIEEIRQKILDNTNGGKIKVVERCFGFVEETIGEEIIICVQLPDKTEDKKTFQKDLLDKVAIGEPSKFLEITTVERIRGNGMTLETIFKWLQNASS